MQLYIQLKTLLNSKFIIVLYTKNCSYQRIKINFYRNVARTKNQARGNIYKTRKCHYIKHY